jgi:pilus assembly protein Flp/PilA
MALYNCRNFRHRTTTIYHERGSQAMLRSFFAKEDGQGLVEYALILVLIAIVVIGILSLLGGKVSQVFSTINSGLNP